MSYLTPAFSNAADRNLRSAVSQRAEDLLSGRMTPTFAVLAGALLEPLSDLLPPQAAIPPAATMATARARMPLRMSTDPFGRAAATRRSGGGEKRLVPANDLTRAAAGCGPDRSWWSQACDG